MNQLVIFACVVVAVAASGGYRAPSHNIGGGFGGGFGGGRHGGGRLGGGFVGGHGGGGYGGGRAAQVIPGSLVFSRLNEYASINDFPNTNLGGFQRGGGFGGGFGGGARRGYGGSGGIVTGGFVGGRGHGGRRYQG